MQEKRENERKAGTGEIRMAIASESMNASDVDKERLLQQFIEAEVPPSSLDAEAFTHPDQVYQILAGQGNEEAEKSLNLVHTTESMMRANDAISNLPSGAGEDFEYGTDDDLIADLETEAGPSNPDETPSWVFETNQ
ncbi:hypothetical protein ACR2XN_28700, partial [Klebsiella pneumoniae]